MKFFKLIALVGAFLFTQSAIADEGMWLPSLINKVSENHMIKMGSKLSADDIYSINNSSLKDAVIALDRGSCTGELVSPEGLFLTNHHCGYGEIQKHSSEEQNILRDGFWAQTRDEELPNPGKTVSFLISVEDVTAKVLKNVNAELSEDQRSDSINDIISELVAEATADNHYTANVRSMFEGNQYLLFVYEIFKDVRLVGAPPHFIGKFGGDTDNWMWPRHTGDFSMFRIYTGPDGKPAEYAEENIPLKPRHYLPVSLKGYEKGDFAMVMGYPGSTDRYLTSKGVEVTMENTNNTRINVRKAKLDIIKAYMGTSEKATIQYASKYARSSNYYKYSIGQNKGLENLEVVAKKKAIEDQFQDWVAQNDEREKKYGEALELINKAYSDVDDDKALTYISEVFLRGPEIVYFSRRFNSLLYALKSDHKDEIESSIVQLEDRLADFFKDYDAETDQKILGALTEIYVENIDPVYYPEFISTINGKFKGDYQKWAAWVFKKSFMHNKFAIEKFLDNPKAAKIEKDPVYMVMKAVYKAREKAQDDNGNERQLLDKGYRLYLAGLQEMLTDRQFYPNANSTMRLTYGTVGDYSPRDGVQYNYYTTMDGYIEKEIPGDREFDVWPRLKELYYANDFGPYADESGQMHTCFTTNNDITGGNSGSPVINGNGELIGIAFDGNWEAMSGDIAFEPELQKCINVDIRFVLWTIDKFAGAKHLVEEMTIVK